MTARIAVIDDEAPNRAYLQTLLSTAGFEVQVATGGNEGVALVEKERPDLVLLDIMMPEVDGFMVCERIRKGPAGAATQIVVLSVVDGIDGKVRALELGADEYLVKPIESRELVTRIKVMLDRAERLRQQGSQSRGRLTVVAGAKGGIGTSTIALNLAALHGAGKPPEAVALADLAVPVGTLGSMLNIPVPDRWAWGDILNNGAASVLCHIAPRAGRDDRGRPGEPTIAVRAPTAARGGRHPDGGRAGSHLRRVDRPVSRSTPRDRDPQPSHPAGHLQPAWQSAVEPHRSRGGAEDGSGGDDPVPAG
ncbi:MAG: response regulator [Chloroflexi bacterium]|nr:MAG: response regulator [Chloroflexota bacterium]